MDLFPESERDTFVFSGKNLYLGPCVIEKLSSGYLRYYGTFNLTWLFTSNYFF